MSEDRASEAPVAEPLDPRRAAWLATAIGIPIYGALSLLMAVAAAPVVEALAPDRSEVDDAAIFVGVGILNTAIAVLGILLIAHTIGRLVFSATRDGGDRRASIVFAVMGALLAAPVVTLVALGQSETAAGAAYAILAVAMPASVTSGLTRAVLPTVAASRAAGRAAAVVAVLAVVIVLAWASITLFGAAN